MLNPHNYTPNDFSKYVGIPFVPGGRDRKGADCYGLMVLVYREMFNTELPEYDEERTTLKDLESVRDIIEQRIDR